jgi:uncharacterized protein YkwD
MRALAASMLAGLVLLMASGSVWAASEQNAWQFRSDAKTAYAFRAVEQLTAGSASPTVVRSRTAAARPSAPAGRASILSAYASSVFSRINSLRGVRGLRPLRVSRGLTAAATYHTNQMGIRGFFEHESANGAPFWKRIERFYPSRAGRGWSVGENILWGSPEISPAGAVREWMVSPPHRENVLSREWREVGIAAIHFASAPGEYEGRPVTIVTADFGKRT